MAKPSETEAIDEVCRGIRQEFVEAVPRYFAGPEPWVRLERLPESFSEAAVATVYSEGPRVRWVVLEIGGLGEEWFETTHYFFDEQGEIRKRERRVESHRANVLVEEDVYFRELKVTKTNYRHSALAAKSAPGSGQEDWETFRDPKAPFYRRTSDLPELMRQAEFTDLARLDETRTLLPAKIQPSVNFCSLRDRRNINE